MAIIYSTHLIKYKHLTVDIARGRIIYLGYDLGATKTEYELIKLLAEHTSSPMSSEEICSKLNNGMSSQNISFHVCAINKKARTVGNRALINNIVKKGYFLNEEM